MNALRLSVLTAVVATLAAPIAAMAAPSDAMSCSAPSRSLVQRRIEESAARGMPTLISFVNRTQQIYQLTLEDAVAWVDSERERRTACQSASADKLAD